MDIVDIVVVGLILILTIGYFVLMVFFPEWVGMSGKVAQKIRKEHDSDEQEKGSKSQNSGSHS